jgi:hypothetical protein
LRYGEVSPKLSDEETKLLDEYEYEYEYEYEF